MYCIQRTEMFCIISKHYAVQQMCERLLYATFISSQSESKIFMRLKMFTKI